VARHGAEQPMLTIDDRPKAIALTIDDGPNPVYTPQVLALLARYRVTATFSMIGIEVQSYRSVAREVAAAGRLIANHTWTHLDLAALSPAAVTEQMSRATDAIHAATGRTPDLFRAPYGAWSPFVLAQCARSGMTPLGWSVDPRDWSRPGVSSIVANIMRNTHAGSIVLEHDGGGDRSQTIAALKIVIPRLLAAGYHFRTP
jgi:peptidoglycan/xylan/chitin deacetylase (PgdA/CDA1 family)